MHLERCMAYMVWLDVMDCYRYGTVIPFFGRGDLRKHVDQCHGSYF